MASYDKGYRITRRLLELISILTLSNLFLSATAQQGKCLIRFDAFTFAWI